MRSLSRSTLLLGATLLLTHCTGNQGTDSSVSVVGAQLGIIQSSYLLAGTFNKQSAPASLLGIYISEYMVSESGDFVEGAVTGMNTGINQLVDSQESPSESFELLQQLGIVLQVDIPDMLNRSTDRQTALDTYIDTLTQVLTRSKTHLTGLKQQQQTLLVTRRDKRSKVVAIQHDLNLALQKKDYTTASVKQSEIVDAKAEQAKADAEVNQIQSTMTLYTDLNKIADKRMAAIQANREALIAGVTVVNIPGVEELGVLQKGSTRTPNNTSTFGD